MFLVEFMQHSIDYEGNMTITRAIIVLRDLVGLSFRRIAREVYGSDESKYILKVYGLYIKATRYTRNNSSVELGITVDGGITPSRSRGFEPTVRLGTMPRRTRRILMDKRERHKEELLRLLEIVYDQLGLAGYDQSRQLLFGLNAFGNKILENLDLDKVYADYKKDGRTSIHIDALAFLYVTYYIATYGTRYSILMPRIWEWILNILPKRSREKKLQQIKSRIKELLPKALDLVLRS